MLTFQTFADEEEAVALANSTRYGLSGIVYTGSEERAERVGRAVRAGTVWVNTFLVRDLTAPFGGIGISGIGREGGDYALDFYSDLKTLQILRRDDRVTTRLASSRRLRLDATREEALERAAAIVAEAWRSFDRARPEPARDRRAARRRCSAQSCPRGLERARRPRRRRAHPRHLASRSRGRGSSRSSGSSGLEIGVLGDLLASCFDVNLAVWAGAASEVEDQAVRWVSEFIGYPAAAGAFTSGGTISNVTALAAARERALPGSRRTGIGGRRVARCTARREAHYSVIRAAELLGLGSDWVRSLPQDERRRLVAGGGRARRSTRIAPPGSLPSPSSRRRGRRSPVPSTRSSRSRTCARRTTCGCTSTARTGVAAASTPSAGHAVRRARARRLGHARRPQVALPPEGVRRRARATPRGPPRRAGARGGLHPARAARPSHGRHHARVLAAVPRAEALARVSRARRRRRCAPRSSGTSARRGCCTPRSARHDDLEALCGEPQLSVVPFRHVPAGVARRRRAQRAARPTRCRRTAASGSHPRGSTGRSACGRASSTTARPTTTCARSST